MRSGRPKKIAQSEEELYDYAVRSLGRKMRTVAELKRLLRRRAPEEDGERWIESVVSRLKDHRYLNDTQFAALFTRMRQENQRFGKRRIQQDLMVKGVHADLIAKTLDTSFAEVDEDQLARKFLDRKRVKRPQDQKESARIMRMLMRAGYSSSTIFRVLRSWGAEIADDAADLDDPRDE